MTYEPTATQSANAQRNPLVWYASYGSNMDSARFLKYIVGGRPEGSLMSYTGCEDKQPPRAKMGVELPWQLYFAGETRVWTGGMAFIDTESKGTITRGRAYLITKQQFEQVVTQECWRDDVHDIDLAALCDKGQLVINNGDGNYDKLVFCGKHAGFPIVTFTAPTPRRPYTKPCAKYLQTIASGLRRSHGLSTSDIIDYFLEKPGIIDNYSYAELMTVLTKYSYVPG